MDKNQTSFEDMELEQLQKQVEFIAGELDRRKKDLAYCIGRKELAASSGLSYSYISEILNTSGNQKPFPDSLEPVLILKTRDKYKERIIDFLCDLTSYEHPEKKAKKPPEQELKELKKALKAKGMDVLFPEHF